MPILYLPAAFLKICQCVLQINFISRKIQSFIGYLSRALCNLNSSENTLMYRILVHTISKTKATERMQNCHSNETGYSSTCIQSLDFSEKLNKKWHEITSLSAEEFDKKEHWHEHMYIRFSTLYGKKSRREPITLIYCTDKKFLM